MSRYSSPAIRLRVRYPSSSVITARPISRQPTRPSCPIGRVVVLHRRFGIPAGFAAAITIIDPNAIQPDGVVTGTPVAMLAPPLTVDNMEALAIEQREGRTVLWVASDDNYFFGERTLLMKFALPTASDALFVYGRTKGPVGRCVRGPCSKRLAGEPACRIRRRQPPSS